LPCTIIDLEAVSPQDRERPIRLIVWDAAAAGARKCDHTFDNTKGAVDELRWMVNASTSIAPEGGAALEPRGSRSSNSAEANPTFAVAAVICPGQQVHVTARWMWDDVGLTNVVTWWRNLAEKNLLRWSAWRVLQDTCEDLEGRLEDQKCALRPVALQVQTSGDNVPESVFTAAATTVAEAIATLRAVQSRKYQLRDRDSFPPEPNAGVAETAYGQYVLETMESHGGAVGSGVRFDDDGPTLFVQRGREGVIEEFGSLSAFKVNWGSHSSHAGMQQCTLIGTADGALHISGVSSESILSVLMKAAADKLRTTMGNPETFERACMRLIQSNKDAAAAHFQLSVGSVNWS